MLKSSAAAIQDLRLSHRRETEHLLNNQAENSHVATGPLERTTQRFRLQNSAQRFLSTGGPICNLLNAQRHLVSRRTLRTFRNQAMSERSFVTGEE